MVFLFSGLAIDAVTRAAGAIVFEVRRQFREHPGIMDGTEKPEYGRVVDICTRDSLRELATPGLLAAFAPIAVGFGLGVGPLAGYLAGAIGTGVLMAVFLANSGGSWDNAKKIVEDGHHGGKGSAAHEAVVIGDTVGDPFKDTAGPAINPLIKVMNLVAVLIAPAVVTLSIGDSANPLLRGLIAGIAVVIIVVAVTISKRRGGAHQRRRPGRRARRRRAARRAGDRAAALTQRRPALPRTTSTPLPARRKGRRASGRAAIRLLAMPDHLVLLLVAGFFAGLIGAGAGLASLVSYPALLLTGLPPLAANVSNTVALTISSTTAIAGSWPELRGQVRRLVPYVLVALVGGVVGMAAAAGLPGRGVRGDRALADRAGVRGAAGAAVAAEGCAPSGTASTTRSSSARSAWSASTAATSARRRASW